MKTTEALQPRSCSVRALEGGFKLICILIMYASIQRNSAIGFELKQTGGRTKGTTAVYGTGHFAESSSDLSGLILAAL